MLNYAKNKLLRAGICLSAILAIPSPANAQWSVIDVSNLRQTTTSALQQVSALAKQVQQYQTQLQQYQNMITNTAQAPMQIWQQAQGAMSGLQSAANTLRMLSNTAGGVAGYLNNFKNPSFYINQTCFARNTCNATQLRALTDQQQAKADLLQATNQTVLTGISNQQTSIESEAAQLASLQSSASTASGQMQALMYANQFAGFQANQMLQIKSLLLNQRAAELAVQQVQADQQAMQAAARKQWSSGTGYDTSAGTAIRAGIH
ncbi:P-type conjugative transfer protein TrbJ [Novosphingobium terrae]|uniref:P-type conjugative transfer protein TrbJ n=1 Tax=Novosphingobium terrae TaxID=2726189 RepID=UPI00197F3AE5|nr:P-type conjugative transfer protein TrbJ [Novosphingobium terrae]